MTDGPGACPPGEAMPAPAVSVRLDLRGPTHEDLYRAIDVLWRMVDSDNGQFDLVRQTPDDGSEEERLTVLRRRPLPQGAALKWVTIESFSGTRAATTTGYGMEGEGDDQMEGLVLERSLVLLYAQWALVCRAAADLKCRATMLTRFRGSLGGKAFGELLRGQDLGVPILARTDVHRYPDGFLSGMDERLGDRAFVAELDPGAVDWLTDTVGRDMSCFNGSARVYQPGWSKGDDPGRHAIWLQRKILPDGADAEFAALAFCDKVFREMFVRPREWDQERDRKRITGLEEEVAALEKRATEAEAARDSLADALKRAEDGLQEERRGSAELIGKERQRNDALTREKDRLRDEKGRLRREIKDLRSRPGASGHTAQAAVEWVADMLEGKEHGLVFGEKVQEGVKKLNPDAGPPEKVLHYLIQLSEFAREMKRGGGSVGRPVVEWFRDRDCEVSPESETTQEMYPREFPVNGRKLRFDWHMKPNNRPGAEGVRIHFTWDDTGTVLVGWVGPHLRTREYGTS